jgi:actin-related protein
VNDQIVENFGEFEKFLDFVYKNEIRTQSKDNAVFITTDTLETNLSETIQLFFEKFQVSSFCSLPSATTSLFCSGVTTGLVVDSGYSSTRICSIYDGFCISDSEIKLSIGGMQLTDFAINLIKKQKKYSFSNYLTDTETVSDIINQLCRVSNDVNKELQNLKGLECVYEFCNYQLNLDSETIMIPELLFKPSLNSIKSVALPDGVLLSLGQVDNDIRSTLCKHVVLSGGNSLFPNIGNRLNQELKLISNYEFSISAIPERLYQSWIGGSIVSSMTSYKSSYLSKELYEEVGRNIIHHKVKNSSSQMKVFHLKKISSDLKIRRFYNILFHFEN